MRDTKERSSQISRKGEARGREEPCVTLVSSTRHGENSSTMGKIGRREDGLLGGRGRALASARRREISHQGRPMP